MHKINLYYIWDFLIENKKLDNIIKINKIIKNKIK